MSSRTIDLAGEVLAIAQIVRLKELEFDARNGFSGGRIIAIAVGLLLAAFGSSIFGASQRGVMTVLGLIIALGVLVYCVFPRKRYILAIELASGSLSGLASSSQASLTDLKDTIRQVIENPPLQPTQIQVGDVYAVDARGSRGTQFGAGNAQFNA